MEWTKTHDTLLCREWLLAEPYKFKKGSIERGKKWTGIALVAERQEISLGICAVQQKAGSVLIVRCMAILQCAAETSTALCICQYYAKGGRVRTHPRWNIWLLLPSAHSEMLLDILFCYHFCVLNFLNITSNLIHFHFYSQHRTRITSIPQS